MTAPVPDFRKILERGPCRFSGCKRPMLYNVFGFDLCEEHAANLARGFVSEFITRHNGMRLVLLEPAVLNDLVAAVGWRIEWGQPDPHGYWTPVIVTDPIEGPP